MAREGKDQSVLLHFTPTRIYNFLKNYFYMLSPIHTHFYYMISYHICRVLKYRFFFPVCFSFPPWEGGSAPSLPELESERGSGESVAEIGVPASSRLGSCSPKGCPLSRHLPSGKELGGGPWHKSPESWRPQER